jgi:predicted peptidase
MSKYLRFVDESGTGTTAVYSKSSGKILGDIEYYVPWKQFVFAPRPDTVFNDECLSDIVETLELLNKAEREGR